MAGQDEGPAGETPGSGQEPLPARRHLPAVRVRDRRGADPDRRRRQLAGVLDRLRRRRSSSASSGWPTSSAAAGCPRPRPARRRGTTTTTGERFGRDKFLELSTLGIGALIGGRRDRVPVVGFAIAPTFIGQGDDDVDLGPLENFPEGEFRVTTFVSKPEQGQVSTRTVFIRNNGFARRDAELHDHLEPLRPSRLPDAARRPDERRRRPNEVETKSGTVRLIPTLPSSFVCPCHGGSYDIEGNRTAGPPVRALDRYHVQDRRRQPRARRALQRRHGRGDGRERHDRRLRRLRPGSAR